TPRPTRRRRRARTAAAPDRSLLLAPAGHTAAAPVRQLAPPRRRRPTAGAAYLQQAMVDDVYPHRRQLADLAVLDPTRRGVRRGVRVDSTLLRTMDHHCVGHRHQPHPMSAMPQLATRPPTGLHALALGLASHPLARRGLRAVVAVL